MCPITVLNNDKTARNTHAGAGVTHTRTVFKVSGEAHMESLPQLNCTNSKAVHQLKFEKDFSTISERKALICSEPVSLRTVSKQNNINLCTCYNRKA